MSTNALAVDPVGDFDLQLLNGQSVRARATRFNPSGTSVVLRPGDTSGAPNVFTDFASLYTACSSIQGGVRVFVDDSIVSPVHMTAGPTYNFNGWIFQGTASFVDPAGCAALEIDQGVQWDGSENTYLEIRFLDISSSTTLDVCNVAAGVEFNLTLRTTSLAMTGTGALFNVKLTGLGGFAILECEIFSHLGDGAHPIVKAGTSPGFCEVNAVTVSTIEAAAITGGNVAFDASSNCNIPASSAVTLLFEDDSQFVIYSPAVVANWSGTAPASVADALDRIAAKIGPIP